MKPKYQRLLFILCAAIIISVTFGVLLYNLQDYMVYFYSPTDIATSPPAGDNFIRVGGMVQDQSVIYLAPDQLQFTLTDYRHDIIVTYKGVVPSLFREGQGIVAEGYYHNNIFTADTILAKHDENYMPPEVKQSLQPALPAEWKDNTSQTIEPYGP